MSRPRVSVIIPAFQSESRIVNTLTRLGRQSFSDFEIVVVDDGSTDETAAVVRRMMTGDRRIRLVQQANQGISGARNCGIEGSQGDVLAFLDDDDLWHPRKLELQLARLDAVPGAALVSCYSALIHPDGRLLGWRFGGAPEGDVYREMLEWDMVSGGSVALVRRRPFEEVGGFDATIPDREDWDLWIRLARRHALTSVPRVLVGYTRRPGSISMSYDRMVDGGRTVLAKARRDDPSIHDAEYRAFLARDLFAVACFCLIDDRPALAGRYLARSLRTGPRVILARPRRCGVIVMLMLRSILPEGLYQGAVAAMSRTAFQLEAGTLFDSLD